MTWAIGACHQLGAYAVMVSDIQVTFSDGTTRDMLRKAYPVGPYIVGAFAGSVQIGFHLLQSIADYLRLPSDAPPNACWEPNVVAEHWAPLAKVIFDQSPVDEQELGSQFLLVVAHPTEDGIPGRAIPYLCKFSWPNFEPEITRNGDSAVAIGSGAAVPAYLDAVRDGLDVRNGLLQGEVGQIGGWANLFQFAMNQALQRHPQPGISQHLHLHVALRGELRIGNSNHREFPPDGSVREVRMPPVAQNYEDLVRMARETAVDAAKAFC